MKPTFSLACACAAAGKAVRATATAAAGRVNQRDLRMLISSRIELLSCRSDGAAGFAAPPPRSDRATRTIPQRRGAAKACTRPPRHRVAPAATGAATRRGSRMNATTASVSATADPGAANGRTPAASSSRACGTPPRDRVDLRHRPVFVVLALHRQHRTAYATAGSPRCSRHERPGRARCRSSHGTPSRGQRGSAPAGASDRSRRTRRAPVRCWPRSRPRRTRGARRATSPATRSGNAAA